MSRRAVIIVLSCAMFAVAHAQESPPPAAGFRVLDERPDDEKKQKILSLLITSCNYSINRLGEKRAPGRFDALHDQLLALKPAAVDGKTLHVTKYNLYFNSQVALRGMVYPMYGGVIVEALKTHGVECPREKMKGGWYDFAELENPHSPLIVEAEATLDGKVMPVRVVYAPPEEIGGILTRPAEAPAYDEIKRRVAAAFAAQLP